jgi:hypothetical protein
LSSLLTGPIQYSVSLGNNKPKALSSIERELWASLLAIASGVPITEGLQTFLDFYDSLRRESRVEDLVLGWFGQGNNFISH